ncbi:AraC family transcriptional regulator [Roseomonas eburnea]|uniref:AraC family transcriptional regulator n=1 Tax=Neoroseomonas eburnea TaxID=1346889 RepID=A0A9X9X5Y9_9PROT|nr:helix-turn-helix transcriptional regulator [Neoroseomonas eburnea]MBR0679125.1 AraC family transcriptional regulator [Neoroseomonas eburnea]
MPSHVTTTMVVPGGTGVLTESVERFQLLDGLRGRLGIRSARLGEVTIARVRSTGHDIVSRNSGVVAFIAPIRGTLSVEAGGRVLETRAGAASYFRPGRRVAMVRPPGAATFEAIGVVAPRGDRRAAGSESPPGVLFPSAAADARARALEGYMRFLLGELASNDSPLHGKGAVRASEALILNLLAEFDLSPGFAGVRRVSTSEAHVRRAEEIIRARSDEPLTLDGLALEVGVGLRALQAAFHDRRGTTPRAMLTATRLERARERLLLDHPVPSVAAAAFLSGFVHLGRFAAAYRGQFGETPSETLRRRRG